MRPKVFSKSLVSALSLLLFMISPAFADLSEPPGGQVSGDVFEKKSNWLHGYLTVAGAYTDNVYNAPDNKVDDFIITVTPGIWMAVPGNPEKIVEVYTSNVTPGGFLLGRPRPEVLLPHQYYLLYQPEFEFFLDRSDENTIRHLLEGSFRYRFPGGLSLDLIGQFMDNNDGRATGISVPLELDEYKTYLINPVIDWVVTPKLGLRFDYQHFIVDYDETRNNFRNRVDNQFAGHVYFNISEKTALTAQYQWVDVAYDNADNSVSDSTTQRFLAGMEWKVTEKTAGQLKVGYGIKDFDQDIDTAENFTIEGQVVWRATEKLTFELGAAHRSTETDIPGTDYIKASKVDFDVVHQTTERLSLGLTAAFIRDDYEGAITLFGETKEREDDSYTIGPKLNYQFRPWLGFSLSYLFRDRDSNFDVFDFQASQINFSITGSI